MGFYINLKCRSCGYSFTGGYEPSNGFMPSVLGVPIIVCEKCNTFNRTGKVLWKDHSEFRKAYHWLSVGIRSAFFGVPIGLVVYAGLAIWLSIIPTNLVLLFALAFIGWTVMLATMVKSNLDDIEYCEKSWRAFIDKIMNKSKDELTTNEKAFLFDLKIELEKQNLDNR